jgi:hypothetical protein
MLNFRLANRTVLVAAAIFFCQFAFGSHKIKAYRNNYADTLRVDSSRQRDMIDLLHRIINPKGSADKHKHGRTLNISIVPTVGYTLSTGFAIGASSVSTFYTDSTHHENVSVINLQAIYDSHSQQTFITQSNLWTADNQYKFVTDLRVNKYPDVTYGLGNAAIASHADNITFNYIRFYQTVLKKVIGDFYAGGGYCLDYHYNITEDGNANHTPTAFDRYGKTASSRSSGINLNLVYDTRTNPVNSLGGTYANVFFRDNFTQLGSNAKWSSVQLDVRKYIRLSGHSNNVLAFWSYTWLTISGKQPYLDLPAVGTDTYNNTGRGYAIDRYRGRNMLYLEGEYRFGITSNGFLGGVIFGNLESYPRALNANRSIIPAAGPGLRIKINKHSNTNLAIDYGIGTGGSHGVFVNLGEVF